MEPPASASLGSAEKRIIFLNTSARVKVEYHIRNFFTNIILLSKSINTVAVNSVPRITKYKFSPNINFHHI